MDCAVDSAMLDCSGTDIGSSLGAYDEIASEDYLAGSVSDVANY